jgi:hypothetical protein
MRKSSNFLLKVPIKRRSDCISLPMVFCPVVTVVMLGWQNVCTVRRKMLDFKQLPPHSAHILPPDSPASQQLQQDRKPLAVKRSLTS